jgi:hypothetical protein
VIMGPVRALSAQNHEREMSMQLGQLAKRAA